LNLHRISDTLISAQNKNREAVSHKPSVGVFGTFHLPFKNTPILPSKQFQNQSFKTYSRFAFWNLNLTGILLLDNIAMLA
jgi:hypothetical protein